MDTSNETFSELTQKKPYISHESVLELQELLQSFVQSPRYPVTSGLQVAQFLTSSPFPPDSLQELTLAELIEQGAVAMALSDGVTQEHLHDLILVLKALIESSEELIDHPGRSEPLPPPENVPLYTSIEADRLISEGFEQLKKNKRYEELKDTKVEEYWNIKGITEISIPAAPFLESLTYGELLKIPASTLLKKRSVTLRKIHHMISLLKYVNEAKVLKKRKKGFIPRALADRLIGIIRKCSSS